MRSIQYCSNCGRENDINSDFCKYCGDSISSKKSLKKNYTSVFDYLKDNSSLVAIAGVFAALSVYLIQFNSANKANTWTFNGTFTTSNIQFFNNASVINNSNLSNNITFSANVSMFSIPSPNFFGTLVPFFNVSQEPLLSMAIASSFSIFFLLSLKIWLEMVLIEPSENDYFISSLVGKFLKWFIYFTFGILIMLIGVYVVYEYFPAVFSMAFILILFGSFYFFISIYLHIKKKSARFFILDSLIYGLILIEVVIISITILFFHVIENGFILLFIILALPGCLFGVLLAFWPLMKKILIFFIVEIMRKYREFKFL